MSVPDPDLKLLIEGSIRDDRKCQQKIFELFFGKMMGACMRYIPDRDEAQDVLQESFIKVFQNMSKFDYHGSFEGWIRRIVVNSSIDYLRKKKVMGTMVDDDYVINNLTSQHDEEDEPAVFMQLKQHEVMDAIKLLTPAYRAVFNLYAIEGYSHQQIADALGISVGTSKSNLAKARMNLQKILKTRLTQLNET